MKNTVIVVFHVKPRNIHNENSTLLSSHLQWMPKLICIYIMLEEVLGLQIFACLNILTTTAYTQIKKYSHVAWKWQRIRWNFNHFYSPTHILSMYLRLSWWFLDNYYHFFTLKSIRNVCVCVCVSNVYQRPFS